MTNSKEGGSGISASGSGKNGSDDAQKRWKVGVERWNCVTLGEKMRHEFQLFQVQVIMVIRASVHVIGTLLDGEVETSVGLGIHLRRDA